MRLGKGPNCDFPRATTLGPFPPHRHRRGAGFGPAPGRCPAKLQGHAQGVIGGWREPVPVDPGQQGAAQVRPGRLAAARRATLSAVAQTKRQIEAALEQAGMHPRHRFGQNFMIDANLVRLIADSGEIGPEDLVLEAGPGTGTLSEELLQRLGPSGRLLAVEIDRDLAAVLLERFAGEDRFELIQGDALAGKHGLNPILLEEIARARGEGRIVRLVANLPYNIASPLVVELLLAGVGLLAFTVQKEVADRLRAGPADGKEYGPLSVVVQTLADVEVLRTIPPAAFWPRPKIDSSLVRLRRREADPALSGRERSLARFVSAIFTMRRKTLRRGLSDMIPDATAALEAVGLTGEERPEQVPVSTFQQLYLAGGAPEAGPAGGSMRAS